MLLSQVPMNEEESTKLSQRSLEILATISHEIRNPLNAIIGLTHLLQASPSQEDRKIYADNLLGTSENLLELINNIMDFSKTEVGKIELLQKSVDLKKNILQNLGSQKAVADQRGLNLNLEIDQQIPDLVKVDSVKLNQVLLNLVSNAIKFTDEGTIRVAVDVEEILGAKVQMKFRVIDSGIGIPSDKLKTIFEAFDQGGEEINRVYGGTGLGLSISRKIVETMGGTLTVKSVLGKGSEFSFALELEITEAEKDGLDCNSSVLSQGSLSKRSKALIVDDNKLNILIAKKYLELWEWDYDSAYNGFEAVEKVQNQDFDIVLMDLHMPEMDGLKATEIIRKLDDMKYQNLPIIGLTASVEKFVEEKVHSVGFNDLLVKPFKPEELLEKIKFHSSQKNFQTVLL